MERRRKKTLEMNKFVCITQATLKLIVVHGHAAVETKTVSLALKTPANLLSGQMKMPRSTFMISH